MTLNLSLDRHAVNRLRALIECASSDTARPILVSVCFSDDGAWATDSYVLGHMPYELAGITVEGDMPPEPVLADAASLKRALSPLPKADEIVSLAINGGVTMTVGRHWVPVQRLLPVSELPPATTTVAVPVVDGQFPNVAKLIPSDPTPGDIGPFNHVTLARVTHLASLFADRPSDNKNRSYPPSPVTLASEDELKPIVVHAHVGGTAHLAGLVMPVRLN